MLRPYTGEYMVSPVPLHMGFNYCSHACMYCFANLNSKDRKVDMSSVNRALKGYCSQTGNKDITQMLLKRGFPVLMSNDSDPFAVSCNEAFRQTHQAFTDLGIRMTYQTKGGPGALEFFQQEPPTMVYISITSDQPETVKALEPGAPSFTERLELALACKAAGHHVVIGLNPYFRVWWDDIHGFLDQLAAAGIKHIWMGALHLSPMQCANIPQRYKAEYNWLIEYGRARNKPDEAEHDALKRYMQEIGINCFYGISSTMGHFWDAYFELGFPFMPTIEGFIDHLAEQDSGGPVAFSLDYFDTWANIAPQHQSAQFKEYLNSFGRTVRSNGEVANARTLREVHEFFWRILDYPTPLRHNDMCIAVSEDAGELVVETHNGNDLMVWSPGSTDVEHPLDQCGTILY